MQFLWILEFDKRGIVRRDPPLFIGLDSERHRKTFFFFVAVCDENI